MPFDRDVTIDFNADISGYSASMGQMIQQTSQYTSAADGMIGKIGKLNNVIMSGVKSMSAFTQTNKVATAQAAAYQQQLSKIETSAKVTGKSFQQLEKTTKGLAKDFPIGMKQAVEQVESLQEAGVTTNKEISQLAKTFTKLGAATGTFGPELGKDMLQLNRTFENGTESMEKYADSLTQVTHQYGANAGAVTAFAKSIAPVAATVGMNETSVIGLSTAFSRLGEDGFAAANTFNKVMLDMSKSIREGTPEAKIYAEVMGTTADQLKETWESNPAEGFIDFVEAIKKQGEGGIRSLEQLGLEGVRTQKTIMSLANSGNMREIVQSAQSSYGSGATGEAAETALGGVNDQITMLNETMAQTAATAGKPFLGFLESVLGVANSLSKVLSDLVESDAIQGLAKVVGIAGGAFGLSKLMTSGALMGSMALTGGKAVGRSGIWRGFAAGRAGTELAEGERPSLGYRAGSFMQRLGGPGEGGPWYQGPMASLRRGGNVLANAMGAYWNMNASQIMRSLDRQGITTPAGERARAALRNVNLIRQDTGITDESVRRSAMAAAGRDAGRQLNNMMNQAGGASNALKGWTNQLRASGAFFKSIGGSAARGGANVLGGVGNMLGGMVGLGGLGAGAAMGLGAVGVAAGAGYMVYRGKKQEEEAAERGGKDAYRMFNDFAEKAGIATKGLVSFADALNESTQKIAAESDSREQAFELTDKERLQAMSPGYERAYSTRGDSFWDKVTNWNGPDAGKEAARIRGMLGPNASPEAINRIQMDLVNQFGEDFANNVMTNYSQIDKLSSEDLEKLLREKGDKSRTMGLIGNTESAEFQEMAAAEQARRQKRDIDIKGQSAVEAEKYQGAEKALGTFNATRGTPEGGADALEEIMSSLELSKEDQQKMRSAMASGKFKGISDLGGMLQAAGLSNQAGAYQAGASSTAVVAAGGYANMTPEEIKALSVSAGETSAAKSKATMEGAGFTAGDLGVELAGTAKTIRDSGMTIEEWSEAVEKGTVTATDMEKAWADVKLAPGDVNAQTRLANIAAEDAIAKAKEAGGGAQSAREVIQAAMTTETGEEIPALKQALQIIDQQAESLEFGKSQWERTGATITTGQKAKALLASPEGATLTETVRAQKEQEVAAGVAAEQNRMKQIQQFQLQQRRAEEDYQRGRARMIQGYEIQMAHQAEDYAKQRKYMVQDYHRSVRRAEEDFYTQRSRAQRDFDKQVTRQSEETAKNMMDPYQRIGPQMVTDMAVLTQSLVEQNRSVQDQLSSVQRLSNMGLSKNAIDQLKLMDPSQNQQVQRMLADAISNPGGIDQINQLIETRMKLGYELNTSEFNKAFQNMKEDFGTSMEDMSDDFEKNMKRGEQDFKRGLRRNGEAFATAQSRAAEAHQLALDQMAEDNATARTRSFEDLTGLAQEYTDSYAEIETKFLQDLANLPSNLSKTTKTAITTVLQDQIDAIEAANTAATGVGVTVSPYGAGWGSGGEGGEDMEGVDGPTAGKGSYSGNWRNYRNGGFHGGADIAAPAGTPTYSVVNGKVKYTKRLTTSYGIHALVTDGRHDFLYGHMSALHVNAGDRVEPGTQIGKVGSTGNSTGNHLHFEVRPAGAGHNSAINPQPWLAEGGVVTRHIQPHVGEGGPEAVIPLNERGAQYLADAMSKASMARYWQGSESKKAYTQQHSSPVTNNVYTYDQRTQFMGEVSVQSQDPEDMARKLAARERRNRLARKTGSAA